MDTMPAPEVLTPEVTGDNDPEDLRIQERRWRVLTLKIQGMPQTQIAAVVNVNQATVSRDLAWIKANWRKEYGIPAVVSPAEEIGEAVAMFTSAEERANRTYHASAGNPRAQMSALRTAMIARQARITLLQDVGLLERQVGTLSVSATMHANDIRRLLRDEGLLAETKRPKLGIGPADDQPVDEDDTIHEWLKGADR